MSKLNPDAEILDWFRKKGSLTIEGNKEYYIILDYAKGKYIYRFGDTMINEDTEVREMPEIELLEYLKAHYVRKAKFWHKKNLRGAQEIWDYIKENPDI